MNRSVLLIMAFWLYAYSGNSQNEPDTVTVQYDCQTINIGDTACISVFLSDIDLFSFQFSFHFDPNAFDTAFITNIHPELLVNQLTFSSIDEQGGFRVLWFSQSTNDVTFSPDIPLFDLCVTASGPPGFLQDWSGRLPDRN